jgi:hypothetical protein
MEEPEVVEGERVEMARLQGQASLGGISPNIFVSSWWLAACFESPVPPAVTQLACRAWPTRTHRGSRTHLEPGRGPWWVAPPPLQVCNKADPGQGVHRPDACSRNIHKVKIIQNIHSISQRMDRGLQAARTRAREWLVNAACGPRPALHFGPRCPLLGECVHFVPIWRRCSHGTPCRGLGYAGRTNSCGRCRW